MYTCMLAYIIFADLRTDKRENVNIPMHSMI